MATELNQIQINPLSANNSSTTFAEIVTITV